MITCMSCRDVVMFRQVCDTVNRQDSDVDWERLATGFRSSRLHTASEQSQWNSEVDWRHWNLRGSIFVESQVNYSKLTLTLTCMFLAFIVDFRCELVDFHKPTGPSGTHPLLFEWVKSYFTSPGFKPPLYFQHQGNIDSNYLTSPMHFVRTGYMNMGIRCRTQSHDSWYWKA